MCYETANETDTMIQYLTYATCMHNTAEILGNLNDEK